MQTAVEWLIEQIKKEHPFWTDIFEQAKEMERQQIIEAYDKCYQDLSNTQKEVDKLATYVSELPQTEISDEEIWKASYQEATFAPSFIRGIEWYREKLKQL